MNTKVLKYLYWPVIIQYRSIRIFVRIYQREVAYMPAPKVRKLCRFKTADIDEWVKKGGASDEREVMK